jgi:hypothetical protein
MLVEAQGAVHHREGAHREHQTALRLEVAEDRLMGLELRIGLDVGLLGVADFDARLAAPQLAVLRVRAGDEGHLLFARCDGAAGIREQGLLQNADLGQRRARALGPDALGDQSPRVGVLPEAARHPDGVRLAQQAAAAGICGGRLERGDHELEGLAGLAGVVEALLDRGDSHQYRCARVQGHGSILLDGRLPPAIGGAVSS